MESDPEDVMFLQVTKQETFLLAMGTFILEHVYPCLIEDTNPLFQKIFDCLKEQKPHWRGAEEQTEGS